MEGYKKLFIFYCSLYNDQGLIDGEAIFSRGGRGGERPKIYGVGWGGEPSPPHSVGRGGEGVKIWGAGRGRGGEHTACTD